ncbi:MAG: hypothetical protein ABR920_01005 [Terriglobales bacterium]
MRKVFLLLAFSLALLIPAFGQGSPGARKIDNEFVQQQFGNQFTLLPEIVPVFGDLDGDGVEDVAIAARCKNPMLDQAERNYTVMDPYYDFFGYGDPRMTTTFSEGDPTHRGLVVLIIHGAGPEGWRSATPKAKYVIVNLPYRTLSVRKMKLRKKTIEAIYVEEAGEMGESSAVFFDGRKFRYVPMGGDMQ